MSKNRAWLIYILSFVSFMLGTLQYIFLGILDQVADSVGISVSEAGQLITSFALGSAIGTPVLILLASKLDQKRLLLLSLLCIFISTIAIAVVPKYGYMLFFRAVLGMGFGVYMVSAFSVVAKLSEKDELARATANLAIGNGLALVVGVPAARLITASADWKLIFWGIGAMLFSAIIVLFMALPHLAAENETSITEQIRQLKNLKILSSFCVTLFMFIGYSSVSTYLAPYLSTVWEMSVEKISFVLMLLGIASVAGAKIGGQLSDRFTPAKTLFICMFIQTAILVLVQIVPHIAFLAIILLCLWVLTVWICGPILGVNLVVLAPSAAGVMLSFNGSFVQFGFAGGAAIGGYILDRFSVAAVIPIGIIAAATAALIGIYSFKTPSKEFGKK